jgi:hypothetical protein
VEQAKTCLHAEIEDLKLKIEQANKKVEDKEMKGYVQDTIEKEAVIKAKEMEIDKLKTHVRLTNKFSVLRGIDAHRGFPCENRLLLNLENASLIQRRGWCIEAKMN